jgi:glycosyltransferase involved in cell wall biosynthesis
MTGMSEKNLGHKKIVICLDGFRHGGTQHAVLHMLPYLFKTFGKVYLIVLQQDKSDLTISPNSKLEIVKFESIKLADIQLIKKLFNFFRLVKPDIVLASMYRSMVLTAFTKNSKSKLIWMEQNTYFMRTKNQWRLLKVLTFRVFKIICISSDVANLTSSKISYRKKIVVIPNPVIIPPADVSHLTRHNDFIFVGRLVKQKNPSLALESFNYFLKTYNLDSHLHIVGDGELMQSLKVMAEEFGIMEKCVFHGFLPNKEVYSILNRTKTMISTSAIEGLAMVRLEALVNGNCLVTTNSGGTEQYFQADSDIGVFLAKEEKSDFSQKMYRSFSEKYWEPMAIEKRKRVGKDFSPEKISSLYITQFNS